MVWDSVITFRKEKDIMAEPFLGEIRVFSFNLSGGAPPSGWLPCDGRTLTIQQYNALYSLLGIQFGGDGRTTFKLPDLRGRVPLGTSLNKQPVYTQGTSGGTETVALAAANHPAHSHSMTAVAQTPGDQTAPAAHFYGKVVAVSPATNPVNIYGVPNASNTVVLASQTLGINGANAPHDNMQPFMALNYCIAITGYYPMRP
jgi:microcystin-dependent protein